MALVVRSMSAIVARFAENGTTRYSGAGFSAIAEFTP
jgi:hypothetical protein